MRTRKLEETIVRLSPKEKESLIELLEKQEKLEPQLLKIYSKIKTFRKTKAC